MKTLPEVTELDNAISVFNVNVVDSLEGDAVKKWNAFVRAWNELKAAVQAGK